MSFETLIEKIRLTDKLLTKSREKDYSKEININQDDWLEIAQKQSEAFRNEHSGVVNDLTKYIFSSFKLFDESEKKTLVQEIGTTKNLKDMLNLSEEYDNIENKILLLIIANSKTDTRDTLLELNEIIDLAKKEGVNYKEIIKKFLPISDDMNKHRMGSMKDILERVIY